MVMQLTRLKLFARNYVRLLVKGQIFSVFVLDFKALKYTPGYRETLWHHNCVAVGMSSSCRGVRVGDVRRLGVVATVLV